MAFLCPEISKVENAYIFFFSHKSCKLLKLFGSKILLLEVWVRRGGGVGYILKVQGIDSYPANKCIFMYS